MKKIKLFFITLICLSLPLNGFAMVKASEMKMGKDEASMQSIHCDQMKQAHQKSSKKEEGSHKQMSKKCDGGSCCVVLSFFAPSYVTVESLLVATNIGNTQNPAHLSPYQEKIYHPPIS